MSIPREDFELRTETVALFSRLKIDTHAILFSDEISISELAEKKRVRLTLVDHNAVPRARSDLSEVRDVALWRFSEPLFS